MRRAWLAVVLLGCRIGGPSEDPMAVQGTPINDTGVAVVDTSTPETSFDSAMPDDVADTRVDVAETAFDAGCTAPFTPITCDPVKNTGCSSLSRCDVADEPKTGRCVGLAALGEDAFCTKTTLTDTCGSTLTCVDNKCKKLCLCDADCGTRCCNFDVPAGGKSSGFKACGDC